MDAKLTPAETIAQVKRWYHTIEVAPGVLTPGLWDHRSASDRVPWPELSGLRCLDVGTMDGFWAFEMERRGAAEVVALDLQDPSQMDWPFDFEAERRQVRDEGTRFGGRFRMARDLMTSDVQELDLNVYELAPERVGQFDLVFMGHMVEHLENPVGALEAVRSVCRGWVIVFDQEKRALSLAHPRKAVAEVGIISPGRDGAWNWFVFNRRGLEHLLWTTGFFADASVGGLKDRPGEGAPGDFYRKPFARRVRHALGLTGRSMAVRGRIREPAGGRATPE